MNQLSLDIPPVRSRRSDPVTSKRAGEKAETFAPRHISIIWNALKDHGPMTPREIATVTGLDYHAVQRRGKELEQKGLIVRGFDERDGMRVWRAA
jgi:DNA-binding MarR family transcriptional regulator